MLIVAALCLRKAFEVSAVRLAVVSLAAPRLRRSWAVGLICVMGEDSIAALWNERKAKMVQCVSVYSGRNTALTNGVATFFGARS